MAAKVIFKPAAQAEIEEAFTAHEAARHGLGAEFLDEISRVEKHLQANPALYQRIDGDIRRAVLRRFPYGLFRVVDGDEVTVLGCLHLHRDPRSRAELRLR